MDNKIRKDIETTLKYLYHAPDEYIIKKKKYIIEYMNRVKQYIEHNIDKGTNIGIMFNKTNKKLKQIKNL